MGLFFIIKILLAFIVCVIALLALLLYFRKRRHLWIIIHGTFARGASWYNPGGDFWQAIRGSLHPQELLFSFSWSGENTHAARMQGAKELISYIKHIARPDDLIVLVGHSHGANVAILAANEITEDEHGYTVETIYTLAPPVSIPHYHPNMGNIKKLYNFFSFGDRVQPVLNSFLRTYPYHKCIWNIQVKVNDNYPDHINMHHPLIGKYLPTIEKYLVDNDLTLINFYDDKEPVALKDEHRIIELENDKALKEHAKTVLYFVQNIPARDIIVKLGKKPLKVLQNISINSFTFWKKKNNDNNLLE